MRSDFEQLTFPQALFYCSRICKTILLFCFQCIGDLLISNIEQCVRIEKLSLVYLYCIQTVPYLLTLLWCQLSSILKLATGKSIKREKTFYPSRLIELFPRKGADQILLQTP